MKYLAQLLTIIGLSLAFLFSQAFFHQHLSNFFLTVLSTEEKTGFTLYALLSVGHLLATIIAAIPVSIAIVRYFHHKQFLIALLPGLISIMLVSSFDVIPEFGWPLAVLIKDTLVIILMPAIICYLLSKTRYFNHQNVNN